jgi:microcin C transport system permease protein
MLPTFFGITLICFLIINLAPGGPIEQTIQAIKFSGSSVDAGGGGSQVGLSEDLIRSLREQYGFDKPILERYWIWLTNIAALDFGESYSFQEPVIDVIISKLPVSLQFGLSSFFFVYLISIPLGMLRAIKVNSLFDRITGILLVFAYAIPPLIVGIVLITFFAGGSYFSWFPTGLLHSDDYETFTTWEKILNRAHHFVLPLTAYILGEFAGVTNLVRNSFLDVIKSDFVRTARAKGLSERVVLFKHALRNSILVLVVGMAGFLQVFLAGSFIVESLFQLDGIGRLSITSVYSRDYTVLMGILFLSAVTSLLGRLMVDILYTLVDPRIDFK